MEHEQSVNGKLFIFGILSVAFSLGLFIFSIYLLPYIIWDLHYDIPDFVLGIIAELQDDYHYTYIKSKTLVWFLFFIPTIIIGVISYFISQTLDKDLTVSIEESAEEQVESSRHVREDIKESSSFALKILMWIILAVIGVFLVERILLLTL